MQSVGNNNYCMISATTLLALYSLPVFLWAENWSMAISRVLRVSIALFINLHVICDVVFVGYIQPDIFIHALLNTHIKLSVNIFQKLMVTKIFLMRVSFAFLRNATENKNVIHQRTLDLALILRENPLVLNTFFNLYNIFLCYISF